jgi:hypothetical protein
LAGGNTAAADIGGLLNWTKLQQPVDAFYPSGFAAQTEVMGSTYAKPDPGIPVLLPGDGQIQLWDGNLGTGITNRVSLGTDNRVPPGNAVTLTVRTASGIFRGTSLNPAGKSIPFQGVVLQKQNLGCGFFLGRTRSGGVYWIP